MLALTVLMAALIGGMIDYILKGQEGKRAAQLIAQALDASEEEAIAVSLVFD